MLTNVGPVLQTLYFLYCFIRLASFPEDVEEDGGIEKYLFYPFFGSVLPILMSMMNAILFVAMTPKMRGAMWRRLQPQRVDAIGTNQEYKTTVASSV